jgi:hypothetical protein
MVNADWHLGGEIGSPKLIARFFNFRNRHVGVDALGKSGSCRFRFRNEYPNIAIALLACIASGVDAIHSYVLVGGKRRDYLTLSAMRVELPAVITAFDALSIKQSAGQRHASVRTSILQSEGNSGAIPPEYEGDLEQYDLLQPAPDEAVAGEGSIPETGEHERVR